MITAPSDETLPESTSDDAAPESDVPIDPKPIEQLTLGDDAIMEPTDSASSKSASDSEEVVDTTPLNETPSAKTPVEESNATSDDDASDEPGFCVAEKPDGIEPVPSNSESDAVPEPAEEPVMRASVDEPVMESDETEPITTEELKPSNPEPDVMAEDLPTVANELPGNNSDIATIEPIEPISNNDLSDDTQVVTDTEILEDTSTAFEAVVVETDHDIIFGGSGNDWLMGEGGNDTIFGNASPLEDALLREVIAGRFSL